jgi:hypothetical protein
MILSLDSNPTFAVSDISRAQVSWTHHNEQAAVV